MIMAHGVVEVLSAEDAGASKMVTLKPQQRLGNGARKTVGVMGSRRIFPPAFKLKVLDSYRNDAECRGNQRATARKYGIHRRQIQKWLQCEENLRKGCQEGEKPRHDKSEGGAGSPTLSAPDGQAPSASPTYVYGSTKLMPLGTQLPLGEMYQRRQYYPSGAAGWTRCEVKPYANGFGYHEPMTPMVYPEVKSERTCSPEVPVPAAIYDVAPRVFEENRHRDVEMTSHVKIERDDEEQEEDSLKRERESTDSETERRSPGGMSPLTPSQEPASPQGLGSSSYRSSSDSDVDAEYSSSSCSSSQNPADLARRRSFSLRFKLDVLDAFHRDAEVAGNQRATAKKFNINRRQVQKWLGQETILRDEIALRGGMSRQRLGSLQEPVPLSESPVDLRTRGHSDREMDHQTPSYCCELGASPQPMIYCQTQEVPYRSCNYPCCSLVAPACYSEAPPPRKLFCYSPSDSSPTEISYRNNQTNPPCCYEPASSPENGPPQDAPLCLVKSKAVATVAPSAKKDAILFKPYLDNPVSKPADDLVHNNNNNNNNCKNICNLNESTRHDYALQLNLQVPASWPSHAPPPLYTDLPQVRSAFVRYPASSHFT